MKRFEKHLITSRDKIYKNPAKVGQAVYDIMSKEQAPQTVEETLEAMTAQCLRDRMSAIEEGCKKFYSPFYVTVERKKETLAGNACNVLRQKHIVSQLPPSASNLRNASPNADFDVYEIDKESNTITLVLTLLTKQDAMTVLKNPHLYDTHLVKWNDAFYKGILDDYTYTIKQSLSA